jgi:predicted kinase
VVELVVLVGLPASGKSTFFRERFAATHELVSKDLMTQGQRRSGRQRELVAAALARGRSVVVDNTNTRRADRVELVAQARAAGAATALYHFSAPIGDCLARNRTREGKARVPDVALFAANRRLEPPGDDEGFDARYEVSLVSPQGFAVVKIVAHCPSE